MILSIKNSTCSDDDDDDNNNNINTCNRPDYIAQFIMIKVNNNNYHSSAINTASTIATSSDCSYTVLIVTVTISLILTIICFPTSSSSSNS